MESKTLTCTAGVSMEMMCHTSGLLYLEQGDQYRDYILSYSFSSGDKVSIKDIVPDREKDLTPGRTFFGLVKLTADWI